MKKNLCTLSAAVLTCCIAAPAALAQLSITNGDFENGAGAQLPDVADWYEYDGDALAWWQQTSQDNTPAISPFPGDSSYLFQTSAEENFAYQSVGTNADDLDSIYVAFDLATVQDQGTNANQHLVTIGIYQVDNTFVPAENVDIEGAAGATLVDSFQYLSGLISGDDTLENPISVLGNLDLSSTDTSSELYIRVNASMGPDDPDHWTGIDNIRFSLVPEPSSLAILLGAGLYGLALARRRS